MNPRAGILQPNESLSVTFLFTPREVRKYNFATVVSSLLLSNDNGSDDVKCRVPLCVYGEGTMGIVKVNWWTATQYIYSFCVMSKCIPIVVISIMAFQD